MTLACVANVEHRLPFNSKSDMTIIETSRFTVSLHNKRVRKIVHALRNKQERIVRKELTVSNDSYRALLQKINNISDFEIVKIDHNECDTNKIYDLEYKGYYVNLTINPDITYEAMFDYTVNHLFIENIEIASISDDNDEFRKVNYLYKCDYNGIVEVLEKNKQYAYALQDIIQRHFDDNE